MIKTSYFEKHEICRNGKCTVRSTLCDDEKCTKTSSNKKVKQKSKKMKAPTPPVVNILSFRGCSYCDKAKKLLKKHKIPFREFKTVPQIYMMGERLGGYNNLKALLDGTR